jgi:peroxisome-assembly ATPase
MASRLLAVRGNALRLSRRVSLRSFSNSQVSSSTSAPLSSPLERYDELVKNGTITADPHQLAALDHLDALWHTLIKTNYSPPKPDENDVTNSNDSTKSNSSSSGIGGFFSSFFGSGGSGSGSHDKDDKPIKKKDVDSIERPSGAPQGVYIHGGVGAGKTYVMDIFYDSLPIQAKRRVHFNKFMLGGNCSHVIVQ